MNGVQVGGRLEAHRGPSHHVLAGQPLPEGTEKWVASHVDSIDMHGGKSNVKVLQDTVQQTPASSQCRIASLTSAENASSKRYLRTLVTGQWLSLGLPSYPASTYRILKSIKSLGNLQGFSLRRQFDKFLCNIASKHQSQSCTRRDRSRTVHGKPSYAEDTT